MSEEFEITAEEAVKRLKENVIIGEGSSNNDMTSRWPALFDDFAKAQEALGLGEGARTYCSYINGTWLPLGEQENGHAEFSDKAKDMQEHIMRMQQDNERLVWELEKIKLERETEKKRDILQVIWDYYHGDKLKGKSK